MTEPEATSSSSTSPVLTETDALKCSMDSLIVSDSSEDVFNDRTDSGGSVGSSLEPQQAREPGAEHKKKRTRERRISISRDHQIAGVDMEVLKEGELMQQGSFQRFLKRYLTIRNDRLYIAKSKEDKLHEEVILKDVRVAENSSRNVNNSFSVLTPFQQLSFATNTRKEMEEWMSAFKMADSGSKHTAVLEAIHHLEGQHSWFACSHPRPTYCNVCREQLHGVAWHGLSCEVCKFKSHRRCIFTVKAPCKWTTRSSLASSGHQLEQDFSIPHEWMEGNLPQGSKCTVCERNCGTVRRLKDFRCIWCKQTVHTECRSRLDPLCSLGDHRLSILPPSALQRSDAIRGGMWEPYRVYGHSPVLALVNSKSGDNQGVKFLRKLKYWLNPAQVFDLAISGPELGLELFQRFEKFRVIVLGGDGSIGWVLSAIDRLNLHSKCMVGVVPLGTGNDLARVMGWGSQAQDEEKIPQILADMEQSSFKLLDRWSVHYSPDQNLDISHMLRSTSPSKLRASLLSPRPSSSAHLAPFPGPAMTLSEAVSPADSVFSHISTSSNDSSEQQPSSQTSEQRSSNDVCQQQPSNNTSQQRLSNNTSEQKPGLVLQDFDLEIKGNDKTSSGVVGVANTSPQDIAKIEALHNSISDMASHFATILFSESGEEVLASSHVLGKVVADFLGSVVAGAEDQLSVGEFNSDPVVAKCVILQDKLNALLSNLKNKSLVKEETKQRVFVEREDVMARANSLKKALRGVLDVTERALDDSTEQGLSIVSEEVRPDSAHNERQLEKQISEPSSGNKGLSLPLPQKPLTSRASVVELSPGIPSMAEIQCMNNYCGIGFGAHVAYQYNEIREKHQIKSRAKSKLAYLYYGVTELFVNSQRYLERRIQLECDGEVIKLPQRLQGLVFLNIPSYMAGTNFWGTEKEKEGFCAPSHDDKLMEVVGVTGFSHVATTRVLGIQNSRLAQCRVAKLVLLGPDKVPMQVDGEPWLQDPGTIVLSHKNKARLIVKDKAFSQSLDKWRQKNVGPSVPQVSQTPSSVQDVLSTDQIECYKQVAASVRPLMNCIDLEAGINSCVRTDLCPHSTSLSTCLRRMIQENQLSDTVDISHLQDFEQAVKALLQETLWFLNMHKISVANEHEMRSSVQMVESQMRRIVSIDLSQCSVAHRRFRRASDTVLVRGEGMGSPHRQRSKLIPDVTIQAATIAKKIGKDVCSWDNDDVCSWLEDLDLEEYCHNFREHDVTGRKLLTLTKIDLQVFGVDKIGHVTRLWRALQAFKSDSPSLSRVRDTIA